MTTEAKKPSFTDMVARAKWDAWASWKAQRRMRPSSSTSISSSRCADPRHPDRRQGPGPGFVVYQSDHITLHQRRGLETGAPSQGHRGRAAPKVSSLWRKRGLFQGCRTCSRNWR